MVKLIENGWSTLFMKILIRRETEIDQWVYINDQAGPCISSHLSNSCCLEFFIGMGSTYLSDTICYTLAWWGNDSSQTSFQSGAI